MNNSRDSCAHYVCRTSRPHPVVVVVGGGRATFAGQIMIHTQSPAQQPRERREGICFVCRSRSSSLATFMLMMLCALFCHGK